MAFPLEGLDPYSSDDLESEESITWSIRDKTYTSKVRSTAKIRTKFHRLQRLTMKEKAYILDRANREIKIPLIQVCKVFRKWEIITLMRRELNQNVDANKAKWSMSKLELACLWIDKGNPFRHEIYWKRQGRFHFREFLQVNTFVQRIFQPSLSSLNINTCSESELLRLKWIGPCIASKIMKRRNEKAFTSAADLIDRVKGIGSKSWKRIMRTNTIEILFNAST